MGRGSLFSSLPSGRNSETSSLSDRTRSYSIKETFSAELGWWLMLCALSLMLMAVWDMKRRASQRRATVDYMIRAETLEARVSDQEAPMRQRATPGADSNKPDVAELGDSRKRRR
jgi:hypothetical protein